MRFVLTSMFSGQVTIGLVVVSICISVLCATRIQDVDVQHEDNSFHGVSMGKTTCASQPADVTFLMQSMRVHVERVGTEDAQIGEMDGSTQHASPKLSDSDASMVSISSEQGEHASGAKHRANMHADLRLWNSYVLKSIQGQLSGQVSTITIAIIFGLVTCTLLACWGAATFDKFGASSGRDAARSVSNLRLIESHQALQSRSHLLTQSSDITSVRRLHMSPHPIRLIGQNVQQNLASAPNSVSSGLVVPTPATSKLPPLCPSLLMAHCEARFGIPMYQIAELTRDGYGELTIVGITINPLLRAVVKEVGCSRTLEISLPESNSVPRATLTTSSEDWNSKVLAIHGMQGFYGNLEMRSTGACCVVKDGETVLYIDGQADDLHLVLKSGAGLKLADVRCSAEPFGGIEHVEIRVEPDIDTVLIIAVVLAVLLLSPYLPSSSS